MSKLRRPSAPGARRGALSSVLVLVVALAAVAFAACNPPGQSQLPVPSFLPTQVPALEVPSSSVISTSGACLDPSTFAILNQLQAQGADVPSILAQNKDTLVSGLQSFQPQDQATATWRDNIVAALQGNDLTTAAAQIQMLTSGQVSVSSC